jgi:hypothetical protein
MRSLGRDFDVLNPVGRLGNRQAIGAQTFKMELDGALNLVPSLLDGVTDRHAAWEVRHVGAVVPFALLDHDRVAHVVHSPVDALKWYCRKGETAAMKETLNEEQLEPLIFALRGRRVVLDADLARLYGVSTKRFNEAFKRNRRRFPEDFAFQLTIAEFGKLRSQLATTSSQPTDPVRHNWSQFATSSSLHRGEVYRPWVFTEHGALMAANILRSERAIQMSVFVVRAFVRLREHVAANTAVSRRLAEIDETLLRHDVALRDIYQKLLPLLQPPPEAPKRRIGFHTDSD